MAKRTKKVKEKDVNETDFAKEIANSITNFGRQIMGVIPEDDLPGFAYTIGNQSKNLPELLIIGPHGTEAAMLLNLLSEKMVSEGKPFDNWAQVPMEQPERPLTVVTVGHTARSRYTRIAGQYYDNEEYMVQQVIIPDMKGRLPGTEGCDEPYNSIPVLTEEHGSASTVSH